MSSFMHEENTIELQIRAAAITHCISLFIISIVWLTLDIYGGKDTKIKVKNNFLTNKNKKNAKKIRGTGTLIHAKELYQLTCPS